MKPNPGPIYLAVVGACEICWIVQSDIVYVDILLSIGLSISKYILVFLGQQLLTTRFPVGCLGLSLEHLAWYRPLI